MAGDVTNEDVVRMRRRARKCPLCTQKLTDKPTQPNSKELDHILPRGAGGTHTLGNVRIICRSCNVRRPHDGSDFTGQLTLWAEDPDVANSLKNIRIRVKRPEAPKVINPFPVCACGTQLSSHSAKHCWPCKSKKATEAKRLRSLGHKWQEIADALGWEHPASAYLAVQELDRRAA